MSFVQVKASSERRTVHNQKVCDNDKSWLLATAASSWREWLSDASKEGYVTRIVTTFTHVDSTQPLT